MVSSKQVLERSKLVSSASAEICHRAKILLHSAVVATSPTRNNSRTALIRGDGGMMLLTLQTHLEKMGYRLRMTPVSAGATTAARQGGFTPTPVLPTLPEGDLDKRFGEFVKSALYLRGITQKALAETAAVSPASLSKIVTASGSSRLSTVASLSVALGFDMYLSAVRISAPDVVLQTVPLDTKERVPLNLGGNTNNRAESASTLQETVVQNMVQAADRLLNNALRDSDETLESIDKRTLGRSYGVQEKSDDLLLNPYERRMNAMGYRVEISANMVSARGKRAKVLTLPSASNASLTVRAQELLKMAIHHSAMTQGSAAKAVGVSTSSLSKVLATESLYLSTVVAYLAALGYRAEITSQYMGDK